MLTFEFVLLRSSFHPIKMSSRASDFLAFFIIFAFLSLCALLSRSRQTADLFFFCIVFGASASFHDAVRFLFFVQFLLSIFFASFRLMLVIEPIPHV